MPWVSIIMALISFFITKNKTGSTSKALAAGAIAGIGTYYVTHETDWGKANLGSLDGVVASTPLVDKNGAAVLDPEGNAIKLPAGTTVRYNPDGTVIKDTGGFPLIISSTADVLKSWGGTGTAAVIGTAAVAGSSKLQKYLPWVLIGGIAILVLK